MQDIVVIKEQARLFDPDVSLQCRLYAGADPRIGSDDPEFSGRRAGSGEQGPFLEDTRTGQADRDILYKYCCSGIGWLR